MRKYALYVRGGMARDVLRAMLVALLYGERVIS
jgi:hypothetical protein